MSERQDLAELLSPEFEVTRVLGSGSMGTVYLAREVELRRLVAIKVPHPELAEDEQVRARFKREGLAAARIIHPGAATLYRVGALPDDTPYLVMEFLEGKTMDDVLAVQGSLNTNTALSVLDQVASALAAAHKVGVVHRDIRPGNIMWDASTDRAVVTDFGIAGIMETGAETVTRITRAGQKLGEVGFSSPEQLLGDTVTEAADVYSLGVLAHHLLTGEGPYDVRSTAQLVQAHVNGTPRSLRDRIPSLDPRINDVLTKCLAKVPGQRPSAQRVHEVLREVKEAPAGTSRGQGRHHDHPSALPPALGDFFHEFRRRRVGAVAIGYLAMSFVVIQLMDGLLSVFFEDERQAGAVVVAILAAGFPLALVLSWLYDVTSGGIERTRSEDGEEPTRKGSHLAVRIVAVVLSLLVSGGLAWAVLHIRR